MWHLQINQFIVSTFTQRVRTLHAVSNKSDICAGMKSQIAGYWTFEVSREAVRPDLFTTESICTHELPNK